MGAALSYYTVFSLAPLLVVIIAVAGFFFGEDAARGRIVEQLTGTLGREGAQLVQTMIQKASEPKAGIIATVIGLATLLLGATGVLMELHDALDTIWKVIPRKGRGWKGTVRDRVLSFGVILAFGFLLLVSLVLSAGLAAMGDRLGAMVPGWVALAYVLNYGISIGLVALLMATLFVLLPDVRIAWRDVWVGSLVTSVLFHLGKLLIGLYLGKAGGGLAVRGSRIAGGAAGLDLLHVAGVPAGGGVHPRLHPALRAAGAAAGRGRVQACAGAGGAPGAGPVTLRIRFSRCCRWNGLRTTRLASTG